MEFNKYKQLGDYHWREYAQQTVYGKHADKVAKWVGKGLTLDIGAGDGLITSLLYSGIGIDDNEVAVELAKRHNVIVGLISVYEIHNVLGDESFVKVLMADVIEHLKFPATALTLIHKVLVPDGLLYITTPPKKGDGTLHDPYHYKEYSAQELVDFVEEFGFKLVEPIETQYVRMYAKFKKI